jgi:uncharacterized membrane protein
LILAIGGILLVTKIWSEKRTVNISEKKIACPLDTNCQTVLFSRFSKFLGIPVEILGLVFYTLVVLGSFALFLFPIPNPSSYILGLTFLTLIGFLFSLYLLFVQIFSIQEWCLRCMNTFIISTLIFISTLSSFAKLHISPLDILNLNPNIMLGLYVTAISLGVAVSITLIAMTLTFLKDFKISSEEDKKLLVIDNIFLVALGVALFSNLGLISTNVYVMGMKVSLVLFGILGINYVLLNLWVSPRLTGLRLNFSSISVMRTLILRQIALALSAVSVVTWVFIFIFSLFQTTGDPVIMISKYFAYVVVAVIVSQIFPFVVDKMGKKK